MFRRKLAGSSMSKPQNYETKWRGSAGLVFWVTCNLKQCNLCTALMCMCFCALEISFLTCGIHFTSLQTLKIWLFKLKQSVWAFSVVVKEKVFPEGIYLICSRTLFYSLFNTSVAAVAENKRSYSPPPPALAVQSCPLPCAKAHFHEEPGQGIELAENYPWCFLVLVFFFQVFFSLVSASSVSWTLGNQRKSSNDKKKEKGITGWGRGLLEQPFPQHPAPWEE